MPLKNIFKTLLDGKFLRQVRSRGQGVRLRPDDARRQPEDAGRGNRIRRRRQGPFDDEVPVRPETERHEPQDYRTVCLRPPWPRVRRLFEERQRE